jgi:serine protease Do
LEGIVSDALVDRPAAAPRNAAAAVMIGIAAAASGCAGSSVPIPSFAPVVQQVMPAVVNVSAVQRASRAAADEEGSAGAGRAKERGKGDAPAALDELLRRFFEQQDRKGAPGLPGTALGSGFIIDPGGYVVTDDHVVENSDKVTITFQDGSQHSARLIGRDALTDLALLKVEAEAPLPYVRWGDSDEVRVGDWVIAIGNPFGLDNTVSNGIVSARGRDIHAGPYDDFLQIDAAINRGNSGGPTFDLGGNVIGINTAIYSPSGGSVGIGFAIPANLARPVVEQLKEHGRVERGWLGVQIQRVTPEIAQGFGLPKAAGALVAAVSPGTPAARAGFEQGDVILSVNRREIRRMRDLPLIVAGMPVGEPADVTVWRQNREITLRPVIAEMPESRQLAELKPSLGRPQPVPRTEVDIGLKLVPLTAQWRLRLRLPRQVEGVIVTEIEDGSVFAGLDLLPGDVIVSVNREPVTSPKDALAKLRQAATGGSNVLVLINRHGSSRYLAMSAEETARRGKNG